MLIIGFLCKFRFVKIYFSILIKYVTSFVVVPESDFRQLSEKKNDLFCCRCCCKVQIFRPIMKTQQQQQQKRSLYCSCLQCRHLFHSNKNKMKKSKSKWATFVLLNPLFIWSSGGQVCKSIKYATFIWVCVCVCVVESIFAISFSLLYGKETYYIYSQRQLFEIVASR